MAFNFMNIIINVNLRVHVFHDICDKRMKFQFNRISAKRRHGGDSDGAICNFKAQCLCISGTIERILGKFNPIKFP